MCDPGWCQVEEHGTASDIPLDDPESSVDGDSVPPSAETEVLPIDPSRD